MAPTNVERFAAFAQHVAAAHRPEVLNETKRIILGAIDCGLANDDQRCRHGQRQEARVGSSDDTDTGLSHLDRVGSVEYSCARAPRAGSSAGDRPYGLRLGGQGDRRSCA